MQFHQEQWALILGGSSGFGLATAKKLAACGMSVAVVHRDRKGAMAPIDEQFAAIRATGAALLTFNLDATAEAGRAEVLTALADRMGGRGRVRLLMHSIAYGNLKLLAPVPQGQSAAARGRTRLAELLGVPEERLAAAIEAAATESDALADLAWEAKYDSEILLAEEDFAHTIHAMGTVLASWAQDLLCRGLFASDARVLGMTSEGNEMVFRGYAAVAAAKVAMESIVRAMAVELAPYGIRSNVVQAGFTDTPAFRHIPGNAHMKASGRRRNPFGRLTTPEDVADVVYLLCTDEAQWINGTIVRVDGGEHIVR